MLVRIPVDGIALYELESEPLATPGKISPEVTWRMASEYLADRLPHAKTFAEGASFFVSTGKYKEAAFLLHQSIEQAYATALLVLTNYSPASHNLRFLRDLAEERADDLIGVWPEEQQRFAAWFNVLNEAYVKARYSPHYEISKEALDWLAQRTELLISKVEMVCLAHIERIRPNL